jgi:hypothetical protein
VCVQPVKVGGQWRARRLNQLAKTLLDSPTQRRRMPADSSSSVARLST